MQRTTHALGRALVALMHERRFADITVQHVLDRAKVSRSAFYAHYRDKHDVLLTDYERLLEAMDQVLEQAPARRPRVVAVAEFLAHVGEARPLVEALRVSGQLELFWQLATAHFARSIERRLPGFAPGAGEGEFPLQLTARLFAAALVELVKWWLARARAPTPAQMDQRFHDLVRRALRRGSARATP